MSYVFQYAQVVAALVIVALMLNQRPSPITRPPIVDYIWNVFVFSVAVVLLAPFVPH